MNDEIKIKPQVVTPLKKICMSIGELPTSYLETMTYYEMLIWFTNFLRDQVIPVVNNNGEAVAELQNLFVELQNYVNDYFDNLDVQEEINNKLDQMLEDGVLEQIIEQYIQSSALWGFDTVEEMKTATNLINGSFSKTLGYHTKNDGGSAVYKIRTITNEDVIDESFIIALSDDTLIAELIYNDINIKQLGAKGDNTNDDTIIIQNGLSKGANKTLYFPNGTYLINEGLTIPESCIITGDGESSIIKYSGNSSEYMIKIPFRENSQFSLIENIKIKGNYIANGIYDGSSGTGNPTRTRIYNVHFDSCVIGIYLNSMGSDVDNCYIFGEYTSDRTCRCNQGIYINKSDNRITNTRIYGFIQHGLYCNSDSARIVNVKTALCGVGSYFSKSNLYVSIESQENFYDNIQLNNVRSSNFYVTSSGAGIVKQESETIPSTLNEYSLLKITNTKDTNINGSLLARCTFGTDNYSCEGYYMNIHGSIGMNINVNIDSYVQTATGIPTVVTCDSIAGINLYVNGSPYRTLSKRSVTFSQTSKTTKKNQCDNEITFDINQNESGSAAAMLSFPIDASCTNLAVSSAVEETINFTRLTYQYTADGTDHNIYLPVTNRLTVVNPFNRLFRIYENIANDLENDATYQNYVTQGISITNRKILLLADLSTYVGSRTNVKAIVDVYYD